MVTEERKKVINRLKSMHPLRAKVNETYIESAEASKAGKPTVWAMLNLHYGDPILKAMDIEVVYPENYGAVAAATGVAQQYLDRADADGFPTHLCGYSLTTLGYTSRMMKELKGEIPPEAPLGGMPKPVFLLSSAAICDARYKWFQALGRYMDVPVWTLEWPTPGVREFFMEGCYEQMVDLGVKHLRDFVAFVECIAGKKMDWDKLDETVNLRIEVNRVWHEVNELRKVKPCPMHSRDFWSAMPAALFLAGDLKDSLRLYQDMYQEVKDRVDNHIGAIPEEKYRLVFAELPPWHSLRFFDKLAERGWNFVVESFAYRPPIPVDLSKVSDPLERITRFSLQFLAGYYEDARKQNVLAGAFAYPYLKYAREWKCDGAMLHSVISCRSASTHLPYVANMLMEKLKVPSLSIEGDMVDLRLFNPEDALAKAEPFEETMGHYRRVRKQEGFDW
jgi:benzoyl-CoA reductase/2-hydroxyglutaryl-CoA dehydratase subunit BcrC/BadD/HgdB